MELSTEMPQSHFPTSRPSLSPSLSPALHTLLPYSLTSQSLLAAVLFRERAFFTPFVVWFSIEIQLRGEEEDGEEEGQKEKEEGDEEEEEEEEEQEEEEEEKKVGND